MESSRAGPPLRAERGGAQDALDVIAPRVPDLHPRISQKRKVNVTSDGDLPGLREGVADCGRKLAVLLEKLAARS